MSHATFNIAFGLTADPIHKGHEQAIINGVEYCRAHGMEIEEFLLIPVYQPNLIADKKAPVASFEQRFFMCELVSNRLSKQLGCNIQVSDIEKQIAKTTNQKNYSFNTLKRLIGEVSAGAAVTKWLFMLSADHFQGRWPKFRQWYHWQELLQLCGLLINQRPGKRINQNFIQHLTRINENVFLVDNAQVVAVSSSMIRSDAKLLNNTNLVAKDIARYIQQQNLYGCF
jgi:nicotinate (nicotinamide) nucleotide adenylyltransferase